MLKDYSESIHRLGKGLGRAFQRSPMVLGVPGMSIAVKIDPLYYIAVMPAFINRVAEWSGMFPHSAREALMHTGNLIASGDERQTVLNLHVVWGPQPIVKHIRASFILADFVDRALRMHGNRPDPMPVADLRILAEDRELVDAFFKEKTSLDKTAFSSQT